MALRIGIGLPFLNSDGDPHDVASLGTRARWIEEAGFSGIWMGDASFRDLATWPDPFLWMLGAAAATEHVELGFAAYQLPLRNPVDTAQRAVTLQALAPGRFSFGVAPGSTPMAFEAVGESFPGRFEKFARDVDTVRRLSRGERVGEAELAPWEQVRGGPRMLLAAWHGGRNLERAARDYDGWLCSAARTTVGTIVDGLARFRDLGGQRAVVASCSADLSARGIPMGEDDPFHLRCSPAEAADRLAWLADLGFDDVLITLREPRALGPFDSDLLRDDLLRLGELYVSAPPYPGAD